MHLKDIKELSRMASDNPLVWQMSIDLYERHGYKVAYTYLELIIAEKEANRETFIQRATKSLTNIINNLKRLKITK